LYTPQVKEIPSFRFFGDGLLFYSLNEFLRDATK
jgi:hypothetical protein